MRSVKTRGLLVTLAVLWKDMRVFSVMSGSGEDQLNDHYLDVLTYTIRCVLYAYTLVTCIGNTDVVQHHHSQPVLSGLSLEELVFTSRASRAFPPVLLPGIILSPSRGCCCVGQHVVCRSTPQPERRLFTTDSITALF